MINKPNFLVIFSVILLLVTVSFAQNSNVVRATTVYNENANVGYGERRVTGATVRGRLVYEDTGRPIRYVLISLKKISEENTNYDFSSEFVKTDEKGEFVIRNVEVGSYLPIIKLNGILNPTIIINPYRLDKKTSELDALFEKIEITGLGEFNVFIRAKRGGSITGRITFPDGEVAVGLKVEALRKEGNDFVSTGNYDSNFNAGAVETDDRGFYRFSGLPEGKYVVRVTEPASHRENQTYLNEAMRENSSTLLKTYFPEGEKLDKAKEIDLIFGQEQIEINIQLPERKLFRVSGKIIAKSTKQPLKDFSISFFIMDQPDTLGLLATIGDSGYLKSDNLGNWTIRSLPKGKYLVTITQGSVYRDPKSTEKVISYADTNKEIEITDTDILDKVFEIPLESNIAGTYTTEDGKSVPSDFRFGVMSKDGKAFGLSDYATETKVDSNKPKDFFINKLIAGQYKIFSESQDYFITSIKIDGQNTLNSFFNLEEEQELKNVQIVLSNKMGVLNGKVDGYSPTTNGNANNLALDFVMVTKSDFNFEDLDFNSQRIGYIDADGSFEVKAPSGEYSVIVCLAKHSPKSTEETKQWLKKLLKDSPKVKIKVGEIANINLNMPAN